MPKNICKVCENVCISFINFQESFWKNEKLLLEIINNSKLKIKEEVNLKEASISNDSHIYKCNSCNDEFGSKNELTDHRRISKHSSKSNPCQECGKVFSSSKLTQHMRTHTKEKPYVCNICKQGFSMSGNLKRHMMTHTGERPHVCEMCGKGFIQSTSLINHRKTHLSIPKVNVQTCSYDCRYCGRSFKRLARYNTHQRKHFSENGRVAAVKIDEPKPIPMPEYICDICKRCYKTKNLLKAHQLTHGEKAFLCSDCGKRFFTKAALESHLKVHTGEKPHTCNVCQKSFAHVGSFETHMLIHLGVKPHTCKQCSKVFTQLSHLKYHLRTHSGERPYICSLCGKSFALKGNLTVHTRIHTGETPYTCDVCGKGFYDSSSMKKHSRSHDIVLISANKDSLPSAATSV
ncbi:PREDICTED: gastrula zinc finger protein XlCGF57.1-like [Nicrophorus vespilloides]|uniref:Gastrula zinc finger protein XlCGF57.1-like n=1 Tax=Nicrophorus vespilloides TaxID=110193 RepID=A0ABM1NFD7_NICVS|nr:PREDICTED: gastrula zinc finger protein XlCGF57.1-like [Nicrophorus vespilloides]